MAIQRWPHPNLNRMLRNGVFQPPERYDAWRRLPTWTYRDLSRKVRRTWRGAYQAIGNRASDNLRRRLAVERHHAALNKRLRHVWPVFDMTNDRLWLALREAKMTLPQDYELFGRSFDGLLHQYIAPIRATLPDDYDKICQWFPLLEAEFARRKESVHVRRQVYG